MQQLVPDYLAPLVQWPPVPIVPLALGLTYTSMLLLKGISTDILHGAVFKLDSAGSPSATSGKQKQDADVQSGGDADMEDRLKIWKAQCPAEEKEFRIASLLAIAFSILPILLPLLPSTWFPSPPARLLPYPNALACTGLALLVDSLRQSGSEIAGVSKYLDNIAINRPLTLAENRDLAYWIPHYYRQHAIRTFKLGLASLAGVLACWLLWREARS